MQVQPFTVYPVVPTRPLSLQGCTGRLGSLIVSAASAADSPCTFLGPLVRGATAVPAGTQVVVDVSSAVGTATLIALLSAQASPCYYAHRVVSYYRRCVGLQAHALPLVIGTTGDLPMAAIHTYAQRAPVALVANFSVGG